MLLINSNKNKISLNSSQKIAKVIFSHVKLSSKPACNFRLSVSCVPKCFYDVNM